MSFAFDIGEIPKGNYLNGVNWKSPFNVDSRLMVYVWFPALIGPLMILYKAIKSIYEKL